MALPYPVPRTPYSVTLRCRGGRGGRQTPPGRRRSTALPSPPRPVPDDLLQSHGRYPFSAIVDREPYDWPGGRRLAFYVGVNLEVFSFGEGAGPELGGPKGSPDVMNYAWRDYGNRVGVWRLLDVLDDLEIPAVALANSQVLEQAPGVVEAFRERGGEVVAHGRTNAEKPGTFSERDEARLIADATDALAAGGERPLGWLAPHISESETTPDLLAEAGYEYLLDWAHDDQPVWMATRAGRLLSVPYPQELNDLPQVVHRGVTGRQFGDMVEDALGTFLREAEARPVVMGVALHPYLMGQPHRAPHLRRALEAVRERGGDALWATTPGAISAHVRSLDVDVPAPE